MALYLTLIIGLSLVLTFLTAASSGAGAVIPVVFFPLSEIIKTIVDQIASRIKKPTPIPRMELRSGIPDNAATLAVISCLPRNASEAQELVKKLEYYSLANRDAGKNLSFALLLDLPEAKTASTPDDEAIMKAAEQGMIDLNSKYGDRFYLFTRPRTYSLGTGSMCGRERKRGAIEDLVKLIKGFKSDISVSANDNKKLGTLKYLILLDSDTKLTVGSAKKLVGSMLHPLSKPVFDGSETKVAEGHGIIAPAVSVDLDSANASFFASIYGGQGGAELYSFSRSDIYQDVFGRGSFAGKGIVSFEAYAKCLLGRFPPDTVLSHDLPEGEILRSGFADDIEVTDGFPSSPLSYIMRLHRWTRGDWQNLIWLGKRVCNSGRIKKLNPFDALSKWKVIDNIRRSLTAPACFLAFFMACLSGAGWYFAAIAAAASIFLPAIISGVGSSLRAKKGREYRSQVIFGFGRAVVRSIVSLVMLPQTASAELSAALTAMFRLVVSKRNLLKWTTSAETEKDKSQTAEELISLLPTFAAGVFFLFSEVPFCVLGILWLLSPLLLISIGRRTEKKCGLAASEKDYLLSEAESIWRYFETFLTEERGFLPPDNWQEEPALGAAERTSPTNIGLSILSVLSACELSFISRGEACDLCEKMVGTLEKLEKRNGHLYNWYDLKTMRPMRPLYISTVDSGNLAACLTAAVSILRSFGRKELAERFDAIRQQMDFEELYDGKRELFCIGINEKGEREGFYDLFASESRLTSYYACARGICPPKHWRSLGRPMAYAAGRLGLASWNGSVFEYFMPELLLPLYRNSLIWESLRFCAAVQIAANIPWGMSESAFASIDGSGSYRYKAHGAQDAALRRRVFEDRVVAPYASFLVMPLWPKTAVKNLKRLEALGVKGRFGFYEALDYTKKRFPAGYDFVPVKCFMVHHLGMSLIAAVNALHDGYMVKAFLADSEMASFTELLQEKGPVGKRLTTADRSNALSDDVIPPETPDAGIEGKDAIVLSNGIYSVIMTSDGAASSFCGDTALTLFDKDGSSYMMFLSEGDETIPLTGPKGSVSARTFERSMNEAVITNEFNGLRVEMRCCVPEGSRGEVRRIRVSNSGKERDIEVSMYLEPVLSPPDAYLSHPAFSKLSLQTKPFSHGVSVIRRPGGTVGPIAISAASSEPFTYDTSRGYVIGECGTVSETLRNKSRSSFGDVLDPCVLIRSRLKLAADASSEIVFSIACGDEHESSEKTASRLVSCNYTPSRFPYFASNECFPRHNGAEYAGELLMTCLYGIAGDIPLRNESVGRKDLWGVGVSGDHPTAYVEVSDGRTLKTASCYMSAAKYLRMSGFKCDLIVLCSEQEEYSRPFASALYEVFEKLGRPQGVFITGNENAHKIKCITCKAGAYVYRSPQFSYTKLPSAQRNGRFENGAFIFETETSCGSPAWSHVLTNESLGWLVTDCGTFGLWFNNARENRLLKWNNDPYSADPVEVLSLLRGAEEISLFAGRDVWGCRVTFAPGYAVWEKQIDGTRFKVSGCIHRSRSVRIIEIETQGLKEGDRIKWHISPFPPEKPFAIRPVTKECSERSIVFYDHCSGQKLTASFSNRIEVQPDGSVLFSAGEKTKIFLYYGEEKEDDTLMVKETAMFWRKICPAEEYLTPYKNLNDYMNGWCLYQILACRILARSSIYQCGGAIGFRDQLQDVISIADLFPYIAEKQIIEAASHQYAEGDVMHWWHRGENGERDKGVKTRCSDDLLWLPWAAIRYAEIMGSLGIFEKKTQWLLSEPLNAAEYDRYEPAIGSGEASSIYEHCLRAIRLVRERGTGRLGLLKIGGGDWNDGMNRIGSKGKGESVWLTFFAAYTARGLANAAHGLQKDEEAAELSMLAEKWGKAADAAWEGDRYIRGTDDDGEPIGSKDSKECRIDLITQSWAVLSGFGDSTKCQTALDTALRELCDIENGIIKLFDPPFDGLSDPGYIRSYLPGVRENGGRYTHAAIWFAMALFNSGRSDEGTQVLLSLLPKSGDPRYKIEPYVLAADVYSNPDNYARGGWSWYTGSAGWYRTAVRSCLLPSLDESKKKMSN